jgi:CRAL/TRIO domain
VVGEFTEQDSQALCAYFIEQSIAARPEGVDNVMGIFDLSGFGAANADFGFVKFLIQCFFFYYPKRAGEVLMVDVPWAFMPPYNMMKPLLGKYAQLIKFVSQGEAVEYFRPGEAPPDLIAPR